MTVIEEKLEEILSIVGTPASQNRNLCIMK